MLYCQLQSLTDTGLGKLGIMGKKNSPSLWHDELAVCCGNRCYTKHVFSVSGTVWRTEWSGKFCVTNKKEGKMFFFSFVRSFVCCAARQVNLAYPKSFASLGFSSCVCICSVSHKLSSSVMLKYSTILLSCLCKCHHLLIFLVFSFVRKRTSIKLSMHDIY